MFPLLELVPVGWIQMQMLENGILNLTEIMKELLRTDDIQTVLHIKPGFLSEPKRLNWDAEEESIKKNRFKSYEKDWKIID